MRYLKTFESMDDDPNLSEIKDCFLSVIDINHVKITKTLLHNIEVSIGLTQKISPNESGRTKWGVNYKEVINGDELAQDIANSISISMGMGHVIVRAEVTWVNAGEWKLAHSDKLGTGPGLLKKIFQKNGVVGPFDMIDKKAEKARYSFDILPDFIVDKGTRLRHIKIIYSR